MKILVTASSGWLGRTLVPRLRRHGHVVTGIDQVPSEMTQIVGSIADRELVRDAIRISKTEAIVHSAALHEPNIATHAQTDFVSVNVQGTLNLLEEAVSSHSNVVRFIFTSTTSSMISKAIRGGRNSGALQAAWITEEMTPLLPRNIYGVTKLSAEHLCRIFHETYRLPILILRTSRFFSEQDDVAHLIVQSEPNTKANEFLFRRLSVEDAADCHIAALSKASELGFDTFIVSAKTPFSPSDCEALITDAASVVRHYYPTYPELYARVGWTMLKSIDRVYDSSKASRRLGFVCRTGFQEKLEELAGVEDCGRVEPVNLPARSG
jgi:UDP-glucose 4-epimerase